MRNRRRVLTEAIESQVSAALAEDIGKADLTAALIPQDMEVAATVISRQRAILCGSGWFDRVFHELDKGISIRWDAKDGESVHPNQTLCQLQGPARPILTGERTALNFLQTLSATATQTRQYVEAVAETGVKILDTRKTLPGLRAAQKYAVRCGGGTNHRMGLYDAILIKENHILVSGSVQDAISAARRLYPSVCVEVEAENLTEVEEALAAGAEIIMLDNFSLENLSKVVSLNCHRAKLEVSGNVTLDTVRAIAESGVDFISVGALTKDIRAVDLSMRIKSTSES